MYTLYNYAALGFFCGYRLILAIRLCLCKHLCVRYLLAVLLLILLLKLIDNLSFLQGSMSYSRNNRIPVAEAVL